ncbi:MAG: phenylalanine--tRNA ligase subunit beta [Pseudomonadota bacterium]
MRLSQEWLHSWINPGWSARELGERLTMAGLELEALEAAAPAFSGVVVGAVLRVAPHPNADKLRLTWVDAGRGEPLQIVCGAANVAEGLRVPVALPGAVLPGGLSIRAASVRGESSAGMLCSAQELGLEEKSEGLLILDPDAPVGQDLRTYLALDDEILTLGLTPNRADCLSLRGLAREVAALAGGTPVAPAAAPVAAADLPSLALRVEAPAACPRYCGQRIEGIDSRARTPDWLRERLRRAGLRAIHPVVDVANYVMLELGQPLHAFDAGKLQGGLQVRLARAGEELVLLDGATAALAPDMLVIADEAGPQAVAGIMGGLATAVDGNTRSLFLESAFFAPAALAGRARRLGLHTDASHRFERGVDPELAPAALARAAALIVEICGGRVGPVQVLEHPEHLPARPQILLRRQRLARILGTAIPDADVAGILGALGMAVSVVGEGWQVCPPSSRFDLCIEADLIEEVARIHGYANLPVTLPRAALPVPPAVESGEPVALRHLLAGRDYHEVITYSFVSAEWQARIDPECPAIPVRNPISQELGVMRTSLWPGLLQTLHYNLNRQQQRVRIFELGRVFRGEEQPLMLSGLIAGPRFPLSWANDRQAADFFDVKGDVEALLLELRAGEPVFQAGAHHALHPGQTADIRAGGRWVGRLGTLHPRLLQALDLSQTPVLFELDLQALRAARAASPCYTGLSRFPMLRRDLALLVPRSVPAAEIAAAIAAAVPSLIREVQLFDRYQGAGIPEDQQSLAFSLLLQSDEKTLDDEAINRAMEAVLMRVRQVCPVTLRQ